MKKYSYNGLCMELFSYICSINANNMKKIFTCLLAMFGLVSACCQTNYEVDAFKTKSGKTIKFHALMHASIRMEYDGKEIEV